MNYYINAIASSETISYDIKELIPDATMRRRMSRWVKQGVATGIECLKKNILTEQVDGIITATGLGCLENSEKFLKNLLENDEDLLNPTPFIQSTFNTIGAQIGLLCENHAYNMTFTNRGNSFESALLDAMLLLQEDSYHHILVGAIDYNIPSQLKIMDRMGLWQKAEPMEGAFFFLLSDVPLEHCLGRISCLSFLREGMEMNMTAVNREPAVINDSEIFKIEIEPGIQAIASASALFTALTNERTRYASISVVNRVDKNQIVRTEIICC